MNTGQFKIRTKDGKNEYLLQENRSTAVPGKKPQNGRTLHLTDYCGNCYTGVRKANRVAKAIREKFPKHEISVEHYGASFEIEVYYEIEFTTIEALHEAVLSVAEVADEGAGIGYEMLGEDFERQK